MSHRRRLPIAAAAAIAVVLGVPAASAGAAPALPAPQAVNVFDRAVEIKPPPSLDINNTPDDALSAVSCPAFGSYVAGGGYINANGEPGDFLGEVTSLAHGNASTNPGPFFNSISCRIVGYCADAAISTQASLSSVSCTTRGDCVAVGSYVDKFGNTQIMILTQKAGLWGRASRIASPATAARPIAAEAAGISCIRTGSCVAVGGYVHSHSKTFVPLTFTESSGTWHRPTEITLPRNAVTGKGNGAGLGSVSCTPSGFCAAVGSYGTRKTGAMMAVTGSRGLSGRAAQITATPLAGGRHRDGRELRIRT